MVNINFVPDDYVQNKETKRVNFMYVGLLVLVLAGIGGAFTLIKMRQNSLVEREKTIDAELTKKSEDIRKLEELQVKSKTMMKTALTTAELIDPVPKSLLVASLTNNLPVGMSLLNLNMIQKEAAKPAAASPADSKFDAAKKAAATPAAAEESLEKRLETFIEIQGIAPTDLQVAAYIEKLSTSVLVEDVKLVESKEYKYNDLTFRCFKLTAALKKKIQITSADIDHIKGSKEKARNCF